MRVWDLVHSRGLILDRSKLGTPPVIGRKERTWHGGRYRMDVRVGLGGYSLFMFSTKYKEGHYLRVKGEKGNAGG